MKRAGIFKFLILLALPFMLLADDSYRVLEYGLLDYSSKPGVGPYRVSGKLFFGIKNSFYEEDKPEIIFQVKPGYNEYVYLNVVNQSSSEKKFKIAIDSDETLLMGIHEESDNDAENFTSLQPNQMADVPVALFAQDTINSFHSFTAKLVDETGAVVDILNGKVYIQEPADNYSVSLKSTSGLIKTYTLKNNGEPITNISVNLEGTENYTIVPDIKHYLMKKDETVEFSVVPVKPFNKDVIAKLIVNSSGQVKEFPFEIKVPPGTAIQTVSLDPIARLRKKDWYCTNRPIIHLDFEIPFVKIIPLDYSGNIPDWLDQKIKTLKSKGTSYDTTNNGSPDHWDLAEGNLVIMSGDDYDRDGSIDFFRESDSTGRTLNRAYVKIKGKWNETNIVSAYLVSGFLPYASYKKIYPHDVKVLFNNELIKERKHVVPRGSNVYRLRLDYLNPPSNTISFNRVTIDTKHLPKVSYQVNAENTLIIHYSSIDFPVASRLKVELDTSEIDSFIRKEEEKIRSMEEGGLKEAAKNTLKEFKDKRDAILKEAGSKNYNTLASGIQDDGLDLAVYSSETGINEDRKLIYGVVRNMGYEKAGYRLTLESSTNSSPFKTLFSKDYPPVLPFERKRFAISENNYDPRKRVVYRVKVTALSAGSKKELDESNNTAHIVSGPEPKNPDTRHNELKFLAKEMGHDQDQVTLIRPENPLVRIQKAKLTYEQDKIIRKADFTAPLVNIKDRRPFIIQ